MLHHTIDTIVQTVQHWGYGGIFLLCLLESTVAPVPSELILIPAGFLAFQGKMSLPLILFYALAGGLCGASINYAFALWVGRPFLERWGRYFFVRPALLHKTDHFFRHYGAISIFTGRLIPGIRHLISLPAGLSAMPFLRFSAYTLLGVGAWSTLLISMGYFVGNNLPLIQRQLQHITLAIISISLIGAIGYILWQRQLEQRERLAAQKRAQQHPHNKKPL